MYPAGLHCPYLVLDHLPTLLAFMTKKYTNIPIISLLENVPPVGRADHSLSQRSDF